MIPEVNPNALADFRNRNIITNPNCSTIQMLMALKPLHDEVVIARINVATYQSVSRSGKEGVSELAGQTAHLLNGRPVEPTIYPQQIAFNLIPQIDSFTDNGYTSEGMKMLWETQKILGDASIAVNSTCVRVPVFYGHAEAVHVELHQPLDAEQVKDLLRSAPGMTLFDDEGDYPTPVRDATGKDEGLVGRVRPVPDLNTPDGFMPVEPSKPDVDQVFSDDGEMELQGFEPERMVAQPVVTRILCRISISRWMSPSLWPTSQP